MKSHESKFAVSEVVQLIVSILIPAGVFALAMHGGAALNLFPSPRPALDIDRTILLHQAEASRSKQDADLLLIGDSSCLMDVSAQKLGSTLPGGPRVLNLGTLSYLDLTAYASMLRHFTAANPGRPKTVVLLMHPEALRRVAPEEHHVETLNRYYASLDFCEASSSAAVCWMGGAIFKGRLFSRIVPVPLEGAYARKYGFNKDLWHYLSDHAGSAIDPREFIRSSNQGNAEYRLSARLQGTSQTFRAAVPKGVKLFVGITPLPESFVGSDYRQRYPEMLRQWTAWLRADAALEDLPPTLTDDLFASTTHLNESGQPIFTERLAQILAGKTSRR